MKIDQFYEMILDNMTDGVFVLDDVGNYLFVNRTYVELLNMSKETLLKYNVYEFLKTGQIDICISAVVYKEKKQVIMFQDVTDPLEYGRSKIRQMVIATPVFDEKGKVANVIAIVRPLDRQDELYQAAQQHTRTSIFYGKRESKDDGALIIAESLSMQAVLEMATIVAGVDSNVLLTGDSGTGKEVIAQHIHDMSPRAQQPMVVINCASLPENLLEAELFGYEKGAFTGASMSGKRGLFEEADGGTLFLDEINSMPLNLQGKVLRAIETKKVQRLGAVKTKNVNFRLIAATNENLGELVEAKQFRADLYYRLNVVPINIPPLRERKADVIPLANHFLDYYCKKYGKEKVFTENSIRIIEAYSWPGNVRELKNMVERSVVMSLGNVIEIKNVMSYIQKTEVDTKTEFQEIDTGITTKTENDDYIYESMLAEGISLQEYIEACEQKYVAAALNKAGNTYKAAEMLKTSQTSIMRKKKKYAL